VNNLVDTTMAVRLLLTLMHSLWEGAAIALFAGTAAFAFRRSAAALRYQIFFTALVLTALAAAFTFACLSAKSDAPSGLVLSDGGLPIQFIPAAGHLTLSPVASPSRSNFPVKSRFDWKRYATPLVEIYAAGVVLMLSRLSIAIRCGRRLCITAQPLTTPVILAALHRQAARLGLRFAPPRFLQYPRSRSHSRRGSAPGDSPSSFGLHGIVSRSRGSHTRTRAGPHSAI
jgi:hypothetical protein